MSLRLISAVISGAVTAAVLALLLIAGQGCKAISPTPDEPGVIISTGTVKPGDTLSTLLHAEGLPAEVVSRIQTALGTTFDLRRLMPERRFEVVTSTEGVFQLFTYHDRPTRSYTVTRSSEGVYSSTESIRPTVWTESVLSAEVNEVLYKDLLRQNLPESFVAWFIADLADNIFAWRIDFFTEQRAGDTIQALYEQQYVEGREEALYGGRILAAKYTGKGTRQKENVAIRYRIPGSAKDDYFDHDGKAVRRAFLRAPFTYGSFRISSGYNPRRLHPITRKYRPHHGTDYAAPTGTPIVAIGNGTVVRAGWHGGYGNCVDIRHSGKYTSRYGHLSKIFVKNGQTVTQGQRIGAVGSTGLSTGPHLHFEMLVDGVQRNFLRMDFPSASSVPKEHLEDFRLVRDELLSRLNKGLAQLPDDRQAKLPTDLRQN